MAVAFTAFGAGPAWADPVPDSRPGPPIDSRVGTIPAGAGVDDRRTPSPPVADPTALRGDVEVAPLKDPRSAEYFVVSQETLPASLVRQIQQLDDVADVETVDAARVQIDGQATSVLGVDPSSFRAYAPEPSAESDDIWQGIAEGHLALSHDLGEERDLDLGSNVTVQGGRADIVKQVWTHATSGIAGIDVLASRDVAAELGFPEGNAVIVSAPEADLWELHDALSELLGEDASLQLLAEEPDAPSDTSGEPVGDSTIEGMIAAAESQLGVPYVWGGQTPSQGFDCSGLVQWAFAEVGVSVPRVTHDQWNAGERVEYADAERGDLIFWRNDPTAPGYISHVAIYLGDDTMLEAPRSGLNVRVTDVRFTNMAGLVRVHAP